MRENTAPITHTPTSQPTLGTCSAISGVLRKMLDPMMIPTMIEVESNKVRCWRGDAWGEDCWSGRGGGMMFVFSS